jgi:DNA-binding NarL/FixJ family response regulator
VIRVLVVDDQHLVRAGFRMILEAEDDLTVVGEAANGLEAVELVPRARPDVVLMDVRMPVLDGIEATTRIRALTGPQPAILVLTTFDLDEYVFSALRAGASGFLVKDTPPEQLVDAVRVVNRGDGLLSPGVTRRLIDDVARRRPVAPPPGLASLTERELDVLRLVARGLSNAEIAAELYLGEATVKTHVGRVLAKLDLRDRVQAVVLAYECGLVTPGA